MRPLPPKHHCPTCNVPHWNREQVEELDKHFRTCAHCRKPYYYDYLLKPEVWEATGLGYHDGVLHLPCVEKLIGRPLTLDDFSFELGQRSRAEGQTINDAILWAWAKMDRCAEKGST